MHTRLLRPILLALGALLLGASPAAAQFQALLLEAPITLQVSLTSGTTTTSATERRTTVATARLTNDQIMQDLVGGAPADWSLVAVRFVPPDLAYVDAAYSIYAVKGNQRIAIPQDKLALYAGGSVAKYRERHIGQYVLSSSGTVTNHVSFVYKPGFTIGGGTALSGFGDGFATINYASRDSLGDHEVFFYNINSTRATVRGGLRLSNNKDALVNIIVNVGTPRLVLASTYPDVDPAEPPVILPHAGQ
jgi:hypothetical protein